MLDGMDFGPSFVENHDPGTSPLLGGPQTFIGASDRGAMPDDHVPVQVTKPRVTPYELLQPPGTPQVGFGVGTEPPMVLPEVPGTTVGGSGYDIHKFDPNASERNPDGSFNTLYAPGRVLNSPDSIAYRSKILGDPFSKLPAPAGVGEDEYYRVFKQQEQWHHNIDDEQRDPSNPHAAEYVKQQDAVRGRIMADRDASMTGHSKNYTDMDIMLAQQQQAGIDAAKRANTLGSDSPERKERVKAIGDALSKGYRGNKP